MEILKDVRRTIAIGAGQDLVGECITGTIAQAKTK